MNFKRKLLDWFKLTFWDRVSLKFSHSNGDKVLVTIYPRLLARIFNKIEVGQAWMERYVNSAGFSTWVGKLNVDGVQGILLIHKGYLLQARMERAWASNKQSSRYVPDAGLLGAASNSDDSSNQYDDRITN